MADQLRRSAESIVLNIAEGAGHYSPGRKIYHYHLACGSAGECIAALTHLYRRKPSEMTASSRSPPT
jgi:four helix bundle protein